MFMVDPHCANPVSGVLIRISWQFQSKPLEGFVHLGALQSVSVFQWDQKSSRVHRATYRTSPNFVKRKSEWPLCLEKLILQHYVATRWQEQARYCSTRKTKTSSSSSNERLDFTANKNERFTLIAGRRRKKKSTVASFHFRLIDFIKRCAMCDGFLHFTSSFQAHMVTLSDTIVT